MTFRPEVLRKKADFDRLFKKGRSVGDRYVVLFYFANHLDHNRYAFLASKKVGGSVVRNRARRLMRESVRLMEKEFETGFDLLFIARATIVGTKRQEVSRSMGKALKKGRILK